VEINLLSDQRDPVRLAIAGKMTQNAVLAGGDPLEQHGGRDVYRRPVLVDMQDVEAINAGGVHWLLERRTRFCKEGGRMVLHSLPPPVMDALKLLRLHLVLELADDEAAALAMLETGPAESAG
jgi:ABC-type transporter Mla MlaB component